MADASLSSVPLLVTPEGAADMLKPVPLTPFGKGAFDEAWLQRLIHDNPACLPIPEIEPGLDTFTAICREVPTPRGFIDNLLMTGRGDIAIVEAKLFRNSEARRQAVAQALDYATSLFGMSYDEFEQAALKGTFSPLPKPKSLYEALPEVDKLDEAGFTDAVSRNLKRGRAVILVVGDGIRTEAEALLEGLHAHARFGFTLALVELSVFRMPEPDQRLLVRPRTLAKTQIVRRTVVEVSERGTVIASKEEKLVAPETLSSDAFWQELEVKVPDARPPLGKLIQDAEQLGVYPEFLKSLMLKWDRANGKAVNLGYIFRNTAIWFDLVAVNTPRDLANAYVKDLAQV
jgi:hypothetical protein